MGSFDSFSDFLAMGGYASYVWSAYAFFVLVLVFNVLQPVLSRKKYLKQQLRREQVQQERAQAQQKRKENTDGSAT
jgi:heme exporter protein D